MKNLRGWGRMMKKMPAHWKFGNLWINRSYSGRYYQWSCRFCGLDGRALHCSESPTGRMGDDAGPGYTMRRATV